MTWRCLCESTRVSWWLTTAGSTVSLAFVLGLRRTAIFLDWISARTTNTTVLHEERCFRMGSRCGKAKVTFGALLESRKACGVSPLKKRINLAQTSFSY